MLADEQYFPLQSYRVGPYAAGGTGFFGGFIDYMNLINTRDGGVNGVKLTWSECETQYEVERGVECYERLKSRSERRRLEPARVGIAYAMIDRITADKVPLITVNHGRTDSTDGRVFPYVFPLLLNPVQRDLGHHQLHRLAARAASTKLKGKKIVVLYHGSPYGKETIPIYELLAEKYGFEVHADRGAAPGQRAAVAVAARSAASKPDYVVLRGWGVMNPVALEDRAEDRLPGRPHHRQRLVATPRRTCIPAGDAAKGYIAITTQASGTRLSGAPGDRDKTSTTPARATSRTRSGSAASTTTSASSTASSTSRPCASPRPSSATAR